MSPTPTLSLPPAGTHFGRWTLVDAPESSRVRRGRWWVRCDCGTEQAVFHYNLRKGTSLMCRACCIAMKPLLMKARGHRPPPKAPTLALPAPGARFGDWTLVQAPPESNRRRGRWLVRCSCGHEARVLHYNLRKGISTCCRTCGYRRRGEVLSATLPQRTHGETRSLEYQTLVRMKARCYSPDPRANRNYGDRGIRICSRWLGRSGYANFLADMGRSPGPDWSIERNDNDGNYEPGNCRWIPSVDQSRNTRRNVRITIGDDTRILADWARAYGVDPQVIKKRIARGWDPGRAVGQPT